MKEERSGSTARVASPAASEKRATSRRPLPRSGVCVLGMHRTGSSLVARLLALLGVELGAEEGLLPPGPDNPSGYWESSAMMEINDSILEEFGGRWDDPPELPPRWQDSKRLARQRARAREVLRERFSGAELWGWKDPRNCLTLPFWQQLIPGMRYVVCVRSPADVADSLRARGDRRRGEDQVRDWLRYTALALVHTSARPRIVVHFESLFAEHERQVARLARFIRRQQRLQDPGVREEIRRFIDPELVHGRTSAEALIEDERVSTEAASLYLTLRLASTVDELRSVDADPAPESWAAVNRLAGRQERRATEESQRRAEYDQELKKRGKRVRELLERVREQQQRITELEREASRERKEAPVARKSPSQKRSTKKRTAGSTGSAKR